MAEKSLDPYEQEIRAYIQMEYTQAQMRRALQTVGFSAAELAGIERDNALAILPSYRARG